ncbi:MAG TPA: hypothetical protein VJV21_02115 [Pyrinomonadaceae bacterium]|nr:hypothetical protein [Pyrinomonadaceae bacterium]
MKQHSFIRLVALVIFAFSTVPGHSVANAQPTTRAKTADIFSFVPVSDGVVVVDAKRLLNETLPRVFAADAAKLAHINSELDKFKTDTGVDARAFERVVVSARYTHPSPTVTKLEPVAIAQGKFDARAITLAARLSGKGTVREEKYRGASIVILTVNDQMKLLGLWNMRVRDLAITALNANTIALGTPATVRAVIDAGRTARRDSVELVALATRDRQAVIGFGANVPKTLWASLNLGTDAIAKDVGSIRQAYGSVGTTATDVALTIVARTDTPASAKNLGDTLTGLKQLAGMLVMSMNADRRALAQSAVANLTINARTNEVEIRTQVAAANLALILK